MQPTALITGATRGIGSETARGLRESGFRVFVTGRDKARLDQLRRNLDCEGLALDLSEADAPARLFVAARQALQRIEVLVNNAGFNRARTPAAEITAAELDESYALNLRAPILLCAEALREMAPRQSGHIVNVLSTVVHLGMENYGVYRAMKTGLHGYTGCLIKEARRHGIKVTAVHPGGVNTGFRPESRTDYLDPKSAAQMIVRCITAPVDVVVHELTFRPMVETNF